MTLKDYKSITAEEFKHFYLYYAHKDLRKTVASVGLYNIKTHVDQNNSYVKSMITAAVTKK